MDISFSLDLLTFLRAFGGLLWGGAWAAALQFSRKGQFLAIERTWITVVVGVGIDMAIAYGGDWWTVMIVLFFSSLPIIYRSIHNEQTQPVEFRRNKVLWNIGDVQALLQDLGQIIDQVLETELPQPALRRMQEMIRLVKRMDQKLRDANNGEYRV